MIRVPLYFMRPDMQMYCKTTTDFSRNRIWTNAMHKRFFAVIACLTLLGSTSACARSNESEDDTHQEEAASGSRIVVGSEVPEFTVSSLDNPGSPITRADLDGKVYLIDFWATWCLPCVAELPNLHDVYEEYADMGFEILSIAMGDRREDIARLRETGHPMPWRHAFEPLNSEAAELFELYGLPKAVLADSSHTIVGVDEDVRGENLEVALARLFEAGQ